MDSNSASQVNGDERIVKLKYSRNDRVSIPKKSANLDNDDSSAKHQVSRSEPWSEGRINQELLREGPRISPAPAKDRVSYEATASVLSMPTQDLAAREPRAPPKTFSVSDTISQARQDAETNISVPGGNFLTFKVASRTGNIKSGRRRASSPPASPPSTKKMKAATSGDDTRGRMASLETKDKPKDYSKATAKPSGLVKAETDSCLTCIRYGRKCKGTALVEVDVKGDKQIKCVLCNKTAGHGGRRCYWKDPLQNISTYDEARKAHKGIVNDKNTRAGRIERARMNPNSRLALDPNRTYAPLAAEQRRSQSRSERAATQETNSSQLGDYDDDDDDDDDSIVDDDDIRIAFKDAESDVSAALQAALGNRWDNKMLWASMLVYIGELGARKDIIEGMQAKLVSLIDGAMAQEWLDDDE